MPAIAGATDPPAVPQTEAELDAELLEFLGTVDGLDEEWTEYLAKTDIAKLVKAKSTPKDESND